MPNKCFAPGCKSGYQSVSKRNKETGQRNPTLFSAPKDSELLEKWQKAIPRKDKVFSVSDKLCELHFEEECIERAFTTKLTDGTTFTLERERPLLKAGSIPGLFPNLPKYLSVKRHKRKSPAPRHSPLKKPKRSNISKDVESHTEAEQQQNYFTLLINLENIQKPDSWWTAASTQEYLICSKWNSKYSCERRVVICQDSSVKIFLGNIEISLDVDVYVHDVESLSVLLQRVNDLVICKNAESGMCISCLGYLSEKNKQTLCSACCQF